MKKFKKYLCLLLAAALLTLSWGSFSSVSHAAKGDLGDGYNLDNPNAVYTAVDGEEISSRSDGIVTVLLFARTNGICSNSVYTVRSLCSSSWIKRDDVRVLVVDIDREPVETVQKMQNENVKDTAIFCYDETFAAQRAMWAYVNQTLGETASVTLPVTVIIDGNNKVQYCQTGYISESTIYSYVSSLSSPNSEEPDLDDIIPGVVISGNTSPKLSDARYVLQVALRIIPLDRLSEKQRQAADVVGADDGKIDLQDARAILQRALRIPVTFKK